MSPTRESQEPTQRSDGTKIACIGLISAVIVAIIGLIGVLGAPIITEFAKSLFAPTATSTPTPTKTLVAVLSPTTTDTRTLTFVPSLTPTSTPTPTLRPPTPLPPSSTPTLVPPTDTPTLRPTMSPTPTRTPRPPTATSTNTTTPPAQIPPPTATSLSTGSIALTIYLRDTLTEMGFAALSGDQPNGGMIYEEGKFVYGEAAVQIGETIYHFDKPEVRPGEPEQLPDPWLVEFEFDQLLVARTGNQAGFNPKRAQFWVGTLDSDSAVGEDNPYSLTMRLYEGDELRESIQVFFTVKDAPGPAGSPPPKLTPTSTPPTPLLPSPTSTLVPPTDTPTLQPTPSPTPTPLPTVMIEAEWPKKMEIDRSDSIRVSLVRTADQVFVPTIEIAGHTVIAASPIPVGTLEAPIEKAFGPEYKAFAIANLAGTAFKISPVTHELQSLEQPRIIWEWNIMPEKPGPQTINASIQVQWEPIGGDGETIQRPIWRSRLDILVEEPLIATGQLNAFSLVSAFVGSVLSAPWLYERIKARREKRQKDKESKPKIYLPGKDE